MPTTADQRLTYEEWVARPETTHVEELLDGELVVTPTPRYVHQAAVGRLHARLLAHADARGGRVVMAPFGIRTDEDTVVVPDLVHFDAAQADFDVAAHTVARVPALVVEVLSPSTRSHDLVRKRRIFEQHGIPEAWFVDTDALRIEQVVLGAHGTYGTPRVHELDDRIDAVAVPGLQVEVTDVLRDATEPGA